MPVKACCRGSAAAAITPGGRENSAACNSCRACEKDVPNNGNAPYRKTHNKRKTTAAASAPSSLGLPGNIGPSCPRGALLTELRNHNHARDNCPGQKPRQRPSGRTQQYQPTPRTATSATMPNR
eukprot:347487-Alexandrium_andersonii.AAC.1